MLLWRGRLQQVLHYWAKRFSETGCTLHAYVRMTSHVHLLLTPRRAEAAPRLIISLGRRYVQYLNRSYRRTGTLWESRYKSSLVQAETYLLAAQRMNLSSTSGSP